MNGKREHLLFHFFDRREFFLHVLRLHEVGLCEENILRLLEEFLAVRTELFADGPVIGCRVRRFARNEMEKDVRAFNVAQEFDTEPFASRRAFDESWDVREDQLVIDAEVRLSVVNG